jgi:hypothetical protein
LQAIFFAASDASREGVEVAKDIIVEVRARKVFGSPKRMIREAVGMGRSRTRGRSHEPLLLRGFGIALVRQEEAYSGRRS